MGRGFTPQLSEADIGSLFFSRELILTFLCFPDVILFSETEQKSYSPEERNTCLKVKDCFHTERVT
jgi:hypothetical protein